MANPASLEDLERVLKVLANINRLRLLKSLQEPRGYGGLKLSPSRDDEWGSSDRRITRQAVRRHLRELMTLRVVVEAPGSTGREPRYVLDHARLFAIVEQMRQLTAVRSALDVGGQTMGLEHAKGAPDLAGAHLVLVRGVQEGRAFALEPQGAEWSIGRQRGLAVCLDYDPYISSEHARIVRRDGGFHLVDLPQSKNGTFLNWKRLVRGGVAPLKSGDVVGVGMSLLVFRV